MFGNIAKRIATASVAFAIVFGSPALASAAPLESISASAISEAVSSAPAPGVVSLASAGDSVVYLGEGNAAVGGVVSAAQEDLELSEPVLMFDSGAGLLYFNNVAYSKLETDQKKAFMEEVLTGIQRSSLSTIDKSKMYNFVSAQDGAISGTIKQFQSDTTPDFASASQIMKPFTGFMSTFIGVVAILIFALLGVTITLDLAYISIPATRLAFDKADGGTRFVSSEAADAVKIGANENKNIVFEYFKRKVFALAMIAVCLIWLVGGQFYVLLGFVIGVFEGFNLG